VIFDLDKPLELRKLAQEMSVNEEDLSGLLLESQIEVINKNWVIECADMGKLVNIRNFRMNVDMSKVFKGSRGGSKLKEDYSRRSAMNKKRSY
jgi:hypothetical protein